MSFLNPWVALGIASAVIPALVILYFLKLRRREEPISSTLLWKRAVQDLQVNAPFQRLRKNLLLLLQLLVLGAGVFALARPIVSGVATYEGRVVMLIDHSASMNSRLPEGRTRLEIAKEQATLQAKSFNRTGSSWLKLWGAEPKTQVMVVSFANQASVLQPFSTNMNEVIAAIESVQPTDAQTDLTEAIQLAQAYLAPPSMITQGMEDVPVSPETAATLLLYSDGRIQNSSDLVLKGGQMTWVKAGAADDNAGITAFRTRRDYENPEVLQAFVELRNFGTEPVKSDVSVFLDNRLIDAKTVSLGPGAGPRKDGGGADSAPASGVLSDSLASLSFERPVATAGRIEVRLSREDALAADNTAYAIVPAPRKLRVLLVTRKNWLLETVLQGLPLESVQTTTPATYDNAPEAQFAEGGQSRFDVVIFDKHAPARLPLGNYLFIDAAPNIPGIRNAGTTDDYRMVWWDDSHPVLRYVDFEYVHVQKGLNLEIPPASEVIAECNVGPAVAHVLFEGRHLLIVGFAVEDSELPRKVGFPVFMYNAIRYLGSGGAVESEEVLRPGATLRKQLPAGVSQATILTPDGRRETVHPDGAGVVRFAGTQRIGVYELRAAEKLLGSFAVNIEDAFESDIRMPSEMRLGGGQAVGQGQEIRTTTPEIWRWFVGAALAVAMLEWWIYNRRVVA